jgi:hypothetical protein
MTRSRHDRRGIALAIALAWASLACSGAHDHAHDGGHGEHDEQPITRTIGCSSCSPWPPSCAGRTAAAFS